MMGKKKQHKGNIKNILRILLVTALVNSYIPYESTWAADSSVSLSPNERVVNNYAELKEALSVNNGITTVYFGSDITMQITGIRIHPSKTNIIVDGLNPLEPERGQPYTLTDYNSGAGAFTDTIYIDASGPKTLLVRNLIIVGKNYYGPFSVLDSTYLSDIVVTYEGVDYNGPQIGYHRNGLINFINCVAHIHGRNGGSANQEFSEAKHLMFEGVNTIYTETNTHSVFWMPYGGDFKISADSSLTINSPNTSTTYGLFYADGSAYNIDIDIGMRGTLDVEISSFVASTVYATITSLTVRESAKFHLTTTKTTNRSVLTMDGTLTVERTGALIIRGYGSAGYALITQKEGDIIVNKDAEFHIIAMGGYPMLISLQGRELIFNDPSSVILYNTNRIIEATSSGGRIYVSAEQINYWNDISGGGFDSPPVYSWRKADKSNFWIDGILSTGASGNFSSLSSNYSLGDPPYEQPSASSFDMRDARVLAFGRLELFVTEPSAKSKSVTGVTAPEALLRISFNQQGINYTLPDVAADSKGSFTANTGVSLEEFTVITVKSNYKYLSAEEEVTVVSAGTLELSVPGQIHFFNTEISDTKRLASRMDPNWSIVISDTRKVGEEWRLYARLAQPLTPADNTKPILEEAVVFVNDLTTPLNPEGLLIYRHTSTYYNEAIQIRWPEDQGILIFVPINIAYAQMSYTAVIEWILYDAP